MHGAGHHKKEEKNQNECLCLLHFNSELFRDTFELWMKMKHRIPKIILDHSSNFSIGGEPDRPTTIPYIKRLLFESLKTLEFNANIFKFPYEWIISDMEVNLTHFFVKKYSASRQWIKTASKLIKQTRIIKKP
jgi:hypothetical protein